ncbi:sterol carrier family protein [Streptomyces sp. NPDC002055]|uniref:maleylpyruvate isomerase family mycothiol-dependent enzyme n=1 Tax=Streptomyces sp. NPDC002055 TaxID=3154534 RepID=UPI00332A98F9
MPPRTRRPRTRTYDSAKVRAAVTAQLRQVLDAAAGLSDDQLARPTRLGDWTVRHLLVHLARAVDGVGTLLDLPAPPDREVTLTDWPFVIAGSAGSAGHVDRSTRAATPADGPEEPEELLTAAVDRLERLLPGAPDDRLLAVPSGAMLLGDYLVTRCVELVVHGDDLADALGTEIPTDRQALAAATRLFADALAARAPGGAVEVRIPPFAVVQCVEGPRHTRGTPPNVVETDPLTWIRLATGRTGWDAAVEAGAVTASGERADLSDHLPLMR